MKIVACYKNTPDFESLRLQPGEEPDVSAAPLAIGQYDLNAVEAAMQLAQLAPGSEVIALTAAGAAADSTKQRKAILSRGPDRLVVVKDEAFDGADSFVTASALAAAIERIGGVDLVLFGEGSADMYAQQVGCMVGALLGWRELNSVSELGLDGGALTVRRELADRSETYRLSLPAVISVTSSINRPRIPSMKDILGAGKKGVEVIDCAGLAADSRVETLGLRAPEAAERKGRVFQSVTDEAIEALALEIRRQM